LSCVSGRNCDPHPNLAGRPGRHHGEIGRAEARAPARGGVTAVRSAMGS
jgi:hypothetical protein